MSVMSGILVIIGVLLFVSGTIMLVFRRRVAANMSQAGIVKETRMPAVGV